VRLRSVLLSAVVAITAGALALADPTPYPSPASSPKPILHEPLPEVLSNHQSPTIGSSSHGGNPAAIQAGDKTLPAPPLDAATHHGADAKPDHEPVLGAGGFAADRETTMKPDENTGADSTLHYVSVFNPDVIPFKRMSALDRADDDQTLHVAHTALTELPVGGTTDAATRDRFWGDVLVQLSPGRDVPLPSVAPDMRILSYETKPRIALRFSKDGADNFFVRSDEASASGAVRLVFLVDADARYFAPALPPHHYRVADVAAHAPPELRVALPAELQRDAELTLSKLGVERDMALASAFNTLVGYFRGFTAGTIRHPTGDTYRDLCDSKAGVCRHRAFAFMITANALGIPTRFVANEAHAFVEVWFPERGWNRIDLGGAALRMDVMGADDKTLHRPRADDPFAKPPEYKNSYTQLEGEIKGLTSRQLADKRRGLDQAPPSGAVGDGAGSGAGSGSGANPDRISPDPTLPAVAQDPKKPTPTLQITTADASAYRGATLHIEGIARALGKPLPDRSVRVFIAPAGEGHTHAIALGLATTQADGTFAVDLAIPASATLSTYDLLLATDEDAYYNAALSE
jgi:transglutaminase-like putative cysteine protease